MIWPFKSKKTETRSASGTGYTAQLLQARQMYITGQDGVAEMTATVQSAVSLWETGMMLADVEGTSAMTPANLALSARSLALRGEAVFWISDGDLVPCSDWDLSTKLTKPSAYRLGIADAGGGTTRTALAGEVVHFRIGSDVTSPYTGTPPLRRSSLTAGMLQHVETALNDVFRDSPLGSQIIPYPESPETDLTTLAQGFRGYRGKVQIRESVHVAAAGGVSPQSDWSPRDLTPDLQKAMTAESLSAARDSISMAFGLLPAFANAATTGPALRECQRHLSAWVLQPMAHGMAAELSEKLGASVTLDVMRPLQSFDTGSRARSVLAIVNAMAAAKEAGVDIGPALKAVDWD